MPRTSLAFVWITDTEHQVFLETGYHLSVMASTLQRYICMQI